MVPNTVYVSPTTAEVSAIVLLYRRWSNPADSYRAWQFRLPIPIYNMPDATGRPTFPGSFRSAQTGGNSSGSSLSYRQAASAEAPSQL